MSTIYRDNQYEAVTDPRRPPRPLQVPPVLTDAGRRVYVRTHSFRHFGGQAKYEGDADNLLGGLGVVHVTLHQGRAEWFHCRRFCASGSTVPPMLGIQIRANKNLEEPKLHVLAVDRFFSVATGTGGNLGQSAGAGVESGGGDDDAGGLAATTEGDGGDASANESAAAASSEGTGVTDGSANGSADGSADGSAAAAATTDDGNSPAEADEAREILDECKASEQYKAQFILGIEQRGSRLVAALVTLMGGSPVQNAVSNRAKVKGWLEAPEGARPYHWMTVPQLTAIFRDRYKRSPPSNTPGNSKRQWLIDALAAGWEDSREDLTFMDAIVRAGFLPSLKGASAELCELGHKMEPIYGKNLLEATKGGIALSDGKMLEVLHLFRAGLLQSEARPWQKASPDFLALARVDGEEVIVVVEMKAR